MSAGRLIAPQLPLRCFVTCAMLNSAMCSHSNLLINCVLERFVLRAVESATDNGLQADSTSHC